MLKNEKVWKNKEIVFIFAPRSFRYYLSRKAEGLALRSLGNLTITVLNPTRFRRER